MSRTITKILPKNPNAPVKYKTPGKLQVVVYSRVIKCTGAGVQIHKNIASYHVTPNGNLIM